LRHDYDDADDADADDDDDDDDVYDMIMFMVLSSWQCYCGSSTGSYFMNAWTAPVVRRPLDQVNST